MIIVVGQKEKQKIIDINKLNETFEGLRERTKYIDIIFLFSTRHSIVLFPMFCLLLEGECQILVF